jgi:acyl-CoA synthetase (AMP-forming)/AMP-acid ligase II
MSEPQAVIDAIERYRPTITTMVPTMIGLIMAHPDFRPERLGGLDDLVYGSSPMPKALLETLLDLYPDMNIWQGYGMTEACSVVTMLGPRGAPQRREVPAICRAPGHRGRALHPRPPRTSSIGASPRRRRPRSTTGGTTRETPATWTETATSSWWTG